MATDCNQLQLLIEKCDEKVGEFRETLFKRAILSQALIS
jgi:hypothetical protein